MPRATLLFRQKFIDGSGNLSEMVVWRIPATVNMPSGIRYRLAFVRRDQERPAVLYDNHSPKGDHRHVDGGEEPYCFVDVDRLLADFVADVRRITGDTEWPGR